MKVAYKGISMLNKHGSSFFRSTEKERASLTLEAKALFKNIKPPNTKHQNKIRNGRTNKEIGSCHLWQWVIPGKCFQRVYEQKLEGRRWLVIHQGLEILGL